MEFSRGDVALLYFPFQDQMRGKERPGVILGSKDNEYVVCKITSKSPLRGEIFRFIGQHSIEGVQMGLEMDSYVVYDVTVHVEPWYLSRKIGTCPFVHDIVAHYLELHGSDSLDS